MNSTFGPIDLPGHPDEPAQQQDPQPAAALRYQAERTRTNTIVEGIRADLEEQPSAFAVRSAARRWNTRITAMGDDIATKFEEVPR